MKGDLEWCSQGPWNYLKQKTFLTLKWNGVTENSSIGSNLEGSFGKQDPQKQETTKSP